MFEYKKTFKFDYDFCTYSFNQHYQPPQSEKIKFRQTSENIARFQQQRANVLLAKWPPFLTVFL